VARQRSPAEHETNSRQKNPCFIRVHLWLKKFRVVRGLKSCSTSGGKIRTLKIVRIRFILFVLVMPLLFAGCASNEQYVHYPDQGKVVEDPGKGRIYVIRPKLAGMGISPQITDDGKSIGSTCPRGFLCWERAPGDARIAGITDTTNEVTVAVVAGGVSYIIQSIDFGWTSTDNRLDVVSEQEGKEALANCKPPVCYLPTNAAAIK
jgi:hypothetical protein